MVPDWMFSKRWVKSNPTSGRITTVVLTAFEDDTYRQRCDDLGVSDYIQKPVSEDEFLRVVREHKKLMIHLQQAAVASAASSSKSDQSNPAMSYRPTV